MTIALAHLDPAAFRVVIHERLRDGFSASDVDTATAERLERLFHREIDVREAVREIIGDIRLRGDAALREWTYRIDGVDVGLVHVTPADVAAAWDGLAPELQDALRAHGSIRCPLGVSGAMCPAGARHIRAPCSCR
jgi:hypothetical protein